MERDAFRAIARAKGFDVYPYQNGVLNQYIIDSSPSIGIVCSDVKGWMRITHPKIEWGNYFFYGQLVLQVHQIGINNHYSICDIIEYPGYIDLFEWLVVSEAYVLKSDYDWTVSESSCDIEDLI